jgi:dTDP-4-dehydrorhamnose 3,5-epimerase
MVFRETELQGAFLIDLERHEDERGFFARTFCEKEFAARGLRTRYPQCNVSHNKTAHTLRGMHWQAAPHEEAKVIRCTSGAVWDVVIDIRPGSPTFMRHIAVELSATAGTMLYVPEGLAHGFLTLQDNTDVFYMMSESYAPESARGARWNDPAFGIEWPAPVAVISERDAQHADYVPEEP